MCYILYIWRPGGGMADTADLKSASFGSTGSSPVLATKLAYQKDLQFFVSLFLS